MQSTRIQRLSPVVIDRIAAGEVIEGPHSVLKELMENAIDAGATDLRISTTSGGTGEMIIEDNGSGIDRDDLPLAVERYATSKIQALDDIENITTFGFRGEALAAIASVSHLEILTSTTEDGVGFLLESRGGEVQRIVPKNTGKGTIISVRDLFYATPARKKFLKSERSENQRIFQLMQRVAIAHPEVAIRYFRDGKLFWSVPAQGRTDFFLRIQETIGIEKGTKMVSVFGESDFLKIEGWISLPILHRTNRELQFQYVNGRYVELKHLSFLVKRAYGEHLPPGAHPIFFLFITVDPHWLDVNVHPAKREVRFMDETRLNSLVIRTVSETLRPEAPVPLEQMPGGSRLFSEKRDVFRDEYRTQISELFPNSFEQNSLKSVNEPEAFQTGASYDVHHSDSRKNRSPFLPKRHFGVIFGTYILAETDEGLVIIDQHTAHERINYERFKKRIEAGDHQSQPLLTPAVIHCDRAELARIMECSVILQENGFLIEEFGHDAYLIRETPVFVEQGTEEEVLSHLVDRILEGEKEIRVYDEYAALRACKGSYKRNDTIHPEVISEILKDLSNCEDPSRCPHGRPTMIKLTQQDLDRLFLRTGSF